MASIINRPKGHKWIQFRLDGKHHTWRLGKIGKTLANSYKVNLESLLEAKRIEQPPTLTTKSWIKEMPAQHKKLLYKLELVDSVINSNVPRTIKDFGEFVVEKHYKTKADNTVRNIKQTVDRLHEYFGNKSLETISKGDIEIWREELISEAMAPATVAFYLKKSRRIFRLAVEHQIIEKSPFDGVAMPSERNDNRKFYIDKDTINQLFRVCSPEWQAAICLCRFGGLRFPSEVFKLTWDRVNFDLGRIVVHRPKTDRDVVIPMLPEVRRSLGHLSDLAGKDSTYLFPHYAKQMCDRSAYQQLKRLVIRAGLAPWERLTTNLRVSLGVDLKLAGIAAETVATWMDHTTEVHAQHYDLISDKEFEAASKVDSGLLKAKPLS